jgi:predicted RNase H-like HicB family nuclease
MQLTASIWKEEDLFVAQCLEIDVASQGETEEAAVDNLIEAVELHLSPPVATVVPKLRTIRVELGAA